MKGKFYRRMMANKYKGYDKIRNITIFNPQ